MQSEYDKVQDLWKGPWADVMKLQNGVLPRFWEMLKYLFVE